MSKQENTSLPAGGPGDAPPQYPQALQAQNPGNTNPQQPYSYGQYNSGAPQSQPYGGPHQQPFQQLGAYPPPPSSNFTPNGPAMVGSSGGGPPPNAGYFGGAVPGGSMYGTPYPYQQNQGPSFAPGPYQMNQNGQYGNGNGPFQGKAPGQAKSMCGSCMTGCMAIVGAL